MSRYTIEPMRPDDWAGVRAVYEEGIATGHATFETEAPEWDSWHRAHLESCRWVARDGAGDLCGWAALTPVSGRCVYAGVAEVSVYVAERARGRGLGRQLLERLVESSEQAGLWTLQAGIFPENVPSLRIHIAAGFRKVGRRERIGTLGGVWRDVVLLERRSPVVGLPPASDSNAESETESHTGSDTETDTEEEEGD